MIALEAPARLSDDDLLIDPAVLAAAAEPVCPMHGRRLDGRPGASALTEPRSAKASTLREEAEQFLVACYGELDRAAELADRLSEVCGEIEHRGVYQHTEPELVHGAAMAWRNSARCIGRVYWSQLNVRDMRHIDTAEGIFEACVGHLAAAFNGGQIRPVVSIFAPGSPAGDGPRIWNPQLIRYAGYKDAHGSVIGDPLLCEFTDVVRSLGWRGDGGRFDVLPLVIQMPREKPRLFELPPAAVVEVKLIHPEYPWFAELGLKWHAVPVISNMRLDIGGISYTAAPFSGWYVGYEIGARNLSDTGRYNSLDEIAGRLGLDVRRNTTLWRDRALVELNIAVLASFKAAGVTIIDHHTITKMFVLHEQRERDAGRRMPAEWSWIVPPLSGSTTPVFHHAYENVGLKPNFFSQHDPW